MTYKAIRGATSVDFDTEKEIDLAVKAMMEELYEKNGLQDDDIAFILFSQTEDLKSKNAAAAFRSSTGKGSLLPLFCLQEATVHGQLPRIIRVLVSLKEERENVFVVYQRNGRKLRPDFVK